MSEHEVIARTHEPITVMTLVTHLAACGLGAGQTVLVQTRLSALGWVGPTGTLMMPTPDVEESRSVQWRPRARAQSVVAHDSSALACV
jgi:aminoglycoside N3'-acetyltransferase